MPNPNTPSPAGKFRRRHYFIDRRLQGSFLLRFVIATCAAAGLAGALVYHGFEFVLENEMYSAHVAVADTGELLRGRLILTNSILALALLVTATAIVFRVARGCAFAFRRARVALERVAQGDLSVEVWAKRSDHLDDLFGELNASIGHARACAKQARAALDLDSPGRDGRDTLGSDVAERLRVCAAALRQIGPRT